MSARSSGISSRNRYRINSNVSLPFIRTMLESFEPLLSQEQTQSGQAGDRQRAPSLSFSASSATVESYPSNRPTAGTTGDAQTLSDGAFRPWAGNFNSSSGKFHHKVPRAKDVLLPTQNEHLSVRLTELISSTAVG